MQSTTIEKRFSKIPAVCKRTARSRSALYKAISEGKFPKPYKIGDRAVAWLANDIDAWIDAHTVKVGA